MSILAQETSERITDKRQLIAYFSSAEKPKAKWLIGCEHEKFPFRPSTLKPVNYDEPQGLRDLYTQMQRFGWQPIMENENIIGLTRNRAAISFEPGGQVELSGAPLANLHELSAEIDQHLEEICQIGNELNIGFLGMGFHPTARREDIAWVPKGRYKIMREYMPKRGTLGLDMMLRTCTTQVNLDFSDEADMIKKFRVGLALQPIATALFATSPFKESKPSGFVSYRMNIWSDTDNDRSGPIPFAFDESFGYERYTDYALDVPMYFVYRDGRYIDCAGQSFRDFMQGKLPALPGEIPNMTDWANHLTTLFPDVRLKKIIEMRGADVGPTPSIVALPSFWVGLLYDASALDAAWDMIKGWSVEEKQTLHDEVPRLGFNAEINGRKVVDIAYEAIVIAKEGLRRRAIRTKNGTDETHYLGWLLSLTKSRQTVSDQLMMQAKYSSDFKIATVFDSFRLLPPSKT